MTTTTLRENLYGTFTLGGLEKLRSPVAWSGTKDAAEARAEEAELHAFATDAAGQLQRYYDECGDGETDYAVKVVAGEVVEIVEDK